MEIPIPHEETFSKGIRHPELFLWDAWSFDKDGMTHLYCLAVSRTNQDTSPLLPMHRNSVPFHIRHFTSIDDGKTWRDQGGFIQPRIGEGKADSKTVWSGCIEPLDDGNKLVAFTGIMDVDKDHSFVQSIMLGLSKDGFNLDVRFDEPIISSKRDWQKIIDKGYYLAPLEELGHNDGESGGPVSAWRDPFIYVSLDKSIHLFWGAKVGPKEAALGHALLKRTGDSFDIDQFYPPTRLPDGKNFTQIELPKIYFNQNDGTYDMIVATCNRLYEGQKDEEVDKTIRLYSSTSLYGPWETNGLNGSAIMGKEHLFGLTILKTDFDNNRLLCIAPYTDAAEDHLSLTFSPTFYIYLDPLKIVFMTDN